MPGESRVDLDLTAIAHGGEAIGRWQGKIVFVPYAIPGERVRVRIVEDRRNYARAELLEVLASSEDRVVPSCPHYGVCGGCRWQHISYGRQLDLRIEIVSDQLRRLGHIAEPPIEGIVPASAAWGYRNNVQFQTAGSTGAAIDAQRAADDEAPPSTLGYVGVDGHTIVAVDSCPLAHDLVDDLIAGMDCRCPGLERVELRAGINTGEQMVFLETLGDEAPEISVDMPVSVAHLSGQGRLLTLVGSSSFHERLRERTYRVMAPSFFQVNTSQAENLVEVVQQACALRGGERVLDLCCGVGTFSLPLAAAAAAVVGVEASPWAAADAQANGADCPNFAVHEGEAADVLPGIEGRFDVVVVDPPRGGCGRDVMAQIERLRPQRLVYVSCDPATLARDVAYLHEGALRLERVLAVDMFPQTAHVECVAVLSRPAN